MRHKKEKISYNVNIKKRNKYTAELKTKVVIELLREEGTLNEIAARYGINPVMLGRWKVEFLERAP